jgi:hypothetical protein
MEQLRVPNLLGGALAAISGAVVASFFGVFGTLAGAGVMSVFVAVATAGYAHSLAAAHRGLRRTLLRRAGGHTQTGTPSARPIRWQRVAVAAAVVFALAMGAVTTVEAAAGRPLASLLGRRPQPGASTSVGVVVGEAGGAAVRAPRAPGTSATVPPASAPTTTAPVGAATTAAPAGAIPSTTAPAATPTTSPSTQVPTTQRR